MKPDCWVGVFWADQSFLAPDLFKPCGVFGIHLHSRIILLLTLIKTENFPIPPLLVILPQVENSSRCSCCPDPSAPGVALMTEERISPLEPDRFNFPSLPYHITFHISPSFSLNIYTFFSYSYLFFFFLFWCGFYTFSKNVITEHGRGNSDQQRNINKYYPRGYRLGKLLVIELKDNLPTRFWKHICFMMTGCTKCSQNYKC